MRNFLGVFILLMMVWISGCSRLGGEDRHSMRRILVFSKTLGYKHESIPAAIEAIQNLGKRNAFQVDASSDASCFSEEKLKQFACVVFLNTTGDVLSYEQQIAFERYIQAGGGFVGIHSAADTEYEWPWYGRLVGAYFHGHPVEPNVSTAIVDVVDTSHAATSHLPKYWQRSDEWYNYRDFNPDIKVLAYLDEDSYTGGTNFHNHPISWYHDYDGGRSFYTGGGHTVDSFDEPMFLAHLLGGIQYAMGVEKPDFRLSRSVMAPEENRFKKTVLSSDLNEPMQLSVDDGGNVFFVERGGKFYVYEAKSKKTRLIHSFDVTWQHGNGLLGFALDNNFLQTNWIYLFYTPQDSPPRQVVSRFFLKPDRTLDLQSEKILLEVPIDLEKSAHQGGSLAFDANGNLFISTGDNTVPFESDGFSPIDETPNRSTFDAQRSASNTNDLRGKILRIHPEENGTYTIPDGNLFGRNEQGARAEIFVMGCRNPYRISVDRKTSTLYWGEIGPDAGAKSEKGPEGFDEINAARKAGNYGWPYFIADNLAYKDFDFATKVSGPPFDPTSPRNHSPNNSGKTILPPAQKALIWYPYEKSRLFPDLGYAGRCAMAGPVYHFDGKLKSPVRLPDFFDNCLFIYDWMRNWVFVVRISAKGEVTRLEPFMPNTGSFKRPVDMELGPDGALYILEYGSVYGIDNDDARLVRIEFNPGNRPPLAQIDVEDSLGIAPFKVTFNNRSTDLDENDRLTFEWRINDKPFSNERSPQYTFEKNGKYKVSLSVTDSHGQSSVVKTKITVGNTRPRVKISARQNTTFYFDHSLLDYQVDVLDKQDAKIDYARLNVTMKYIPNVSPEVVGHQEIGNYDLGRSILEASDCKACHRFDGKSVGPSFVEISRKYKGDHSALSRLANKVITGGGGVWGDHSMNAHPQLSRDDATEIVKFVLAAAEENTLPVLPRSGSVRFDEHVGKYKNGFYLLKAAYTDFGGDADPLVGEKILVLRSPRFSGRDIQFVKNIVRNDWNGNLDKIYPGSFFMLKDVDLEGLASVVIRYSSVVDGASLRIHENSPKGPVVGTLDYEPTGDLGKFKEDIIRLRKGSGKANLYFVFSHPSIRGESICTVSSIEFKSTSSSFDSY